MDTWKELAPLHRWLTDTLAWQPRYPRDLERIPKSGNRFSDKNARKIKGTERIE